MDITFYECNKVFNFGGPNILSLLGYPAIYGHWKKHNKCSKINLKNKNELQKLLTYKRQANIDWINTIKLTIRAEKKLFGIVYTIIKCETHNERFCPAK